MDLTGQEHWRSSVGAKPGRGPPRFFAKNSTPIHLRPILACEHTAACPAGQPPSHGPRRCSCIRLSLHSLLKELDTGSGHGEGGALGGGQRRQQRRAQLACPGHHCYNLQVRPHRKGPMRRHRPEVQQPASDRIEPYSFPIFCPGTFLLSFPNFSW
jgi:hypothetical protein